ncbi:MAG: hypothetical protein LQ342_007803 [Letrouitia transgressa]|nr:MAG: hypothetical protein LQ342_007803 [Letrouitia transgressa]
MLDENLPTFYLRASNDNVKHHAAVLLAQYGSEATPAYSLRHPDPSLPASKNRYAAALYDSYSTDVLYGEVLLIPKWTQPTVSQEQIRRNGGIAPAPQPLLPTAFTIQLYNPDQQVVVRQDVSKWSSTPYWAFEMPQRSFRQPSASSIDRTQSDPTASETTPKLNFRWKKDGKLSKDYICSLSGKSTNPDGSKRKNREPDITLSIFKHLKEITMYEPNLSRVEMEDPKGLEVVLLLSAIVLREVYNGEMKEVFNIAQPPRRLSDVVNPRKQSAEHHGHSGRHHTGVGQSQGLPPASNQIPPVQNQVHNPAPPPTDPRTQWEIDTETVRLKKQVEQEERGKRRAERAEAKRIKRMVEEEERKARQKQAEIDKETERLKRIFGQEDRQAYLAPRPALPPRGNTPHQPFPTYIQPPVQRPQSASPWVPPQNFQPVTASGPYLAQLGSNASSSTFFSGLSNGHYSRPGDGRHPAAKSSFFKTRGHSDHQRLSKKQSSVF